MMKRFKFVFFAARTVEIDARDLKEATSDTPIWAACTRSTN
jgi:hypothetical protein